MSTTAERECPGLHCRHWYDGEACCRCDTTQPDTEAPE